MAHRRLRRAPALLRSRVRIRPARRGARGDGGDDTARASCARRTRGARIVAVASHDLRTPLQVLTMANSALEVRSTPGEGSMFAILLPAEPRSQLAAA